jgi:hypothetical protein
LRVFRAPLYGEKISDPAKYPVIDNANIPFIKSLYKTTQVLNFATDPVGLPGTNGE